MTINDLLKQTVEILGEQNKQDAYFEAETLLGYSLGISKVELYTRLKQNLEQTEIESFAELIEHRLHREPLAYITEHQEFYGIDFYVNPHVLIPRPETELLVEETLKFIQKHLLKEPLLLIADIGTGCGCIAISLALNLPNAKIYATDISPEALSVTRINCELHKVSNRVIPLCGNLLEPIPEQLHLIVANLPYVPTQEIDELSPEVKDFEPRLALDGGEDGLVTIGQLLKQIDKKISPEGCLLFEIGQGQGTAVTSLINKYLPGAKTELVPDLNAIDRIAKVIFSPSPC